MVFYATKLICCYKHISSRKLICFWMFQQFLCHCLKFLLQYSYMCHFSVSRQLVLLSKTSIRHLFHTKKSLFEHVQNRLAWSKCVHGCFGQYQISRMLTWTRFLMNQMVLQGFFLHVTVSNI